MLQAPEVMLGDYDQKSDVFSFAILLYELVTQTTPYSRFSRGYSMFPFIYLFTYREQICNIFIFSEVANFVTSGHRLPIPPTVPTFFAGEKKIYSFLYFFIFSLILF